MTLLLDPDPTDIRERLSACRERGLSFDEAWRTATGFRKLPAGDHMPLFRFMRKHFKAAYENDPASRYGRCLVPERDVSGAIGATAALPVSGHCRWGGGCNRPTTRGTFGKMWCERHGARLERIGAALAEVKPTVAGTISGLKRHAA